MSSQDQTVPLLAGFLSNTPRDKLMMFKPAPGSVAAGLSLFWSADHDAPGLNAPLQFAIAGHDFMIDVPIGAGVAVFPPPNANAQQPSVVVESDTDDDDAANDDPKVHATPLAAS